jgi:formylmethanofuran dehydrogenase subunit E
MTQKSVICYSCGNSFVVDSTKQNGDPIICKRCKSYCYYVDDREMDLVPEVSEVKS